MGEPIATVGDLAGICGHDGTNWEKILIDASKRLVVAVASAIAQDAQMHGHISGAWQKQPLIFGYSGVIAERVIDDNVSAGTDFVETTAVPGGEIHVITHAIALVASATCNLLAAYINHDGATQELFGQSNPVSSQVYDRQGFWVLDAGDTFKAYGFNLTAGDDLVVAVAGYKMDLDL